VIMPEDIQTTGLKVEHVDTGAIGVVVEVSRTTPMKPSGTLSVIVVSWSDGKHEVFELPSREIALIL